MSNFKSPTDAAGRASRYLSTFGGDPAWAAYVLTSGVSIIPPAANGAIFTRLSPKFDIASVASLLWVVAANVGNYDIGIFDDAGTRLWSKGSTAIPVPGTVTDTVTGVSLVGGRNYYVGWAASDAGGGIKGLSVAGASELTKLVDGTPNMLSVLTVFPLPSTVTLGSTVPNRLPFIVIRGI